MRNVLILLILLVLPSPMLLSNPGKKKERKDGCIRIHINNHKKVRRHTDSLLVIIDRYDKTYPGIVSQVFYPGANNTIQVDGLAAGKYVVSVVFLGFHVDRFTRTVQTKSSKVTSMKLALADWDEFSREDLYIPGDRFNLCNLLITSMK